MRHLHNLAKNSCDTNMNTKNLAIVWAPNLLKYKIIFILTIINSIFIDYRSKEMDGTADVQYNMLYSITLQANIAEFLISNADTIFDDKFSSLSRRLDLNTFAKTHRPISVCHTTGAKLLSLEEAQARDKQYKQVGPLEVPKFHTVIELNTSSSNNKKKDKDKGKTKRKNSSSTKTKKNNEIKQSSSITQMTQSKISSSDNMTSSLISTKSVNAPQLPILTHQQHNSQSQILPPPVIPTPGPQIQQQLTSAKSFMRNMRGGSTKSSQRELNNEQITNNDAYSSIRSSHSVHKTNNTSSFISNNNTFRSSTTIAKNSPIPPPRVATIEQQHQIEDQESFNSLPRNTDLINNKTAQESPILSTFRHHGECFFLN
jgi:hypothetical protein